MVSIDMPAGPSEVLVIADKHANPVHIAADLLSQVHYIGLYVQSLQLCLYSLCLYLDVKSVYKTTTLYFIQHKCI